MSSRRKKIGVLEPPKFWVLFVLGIIKTGIEELESKIQLAELAYHMRQWCQITGSAHRTLAGNNWHHVMFQHSLK